jgi:glycosyltransferase involved in cell wall biosynthesis
MDLSVIVCTHNPRADYFSRTLAGLAAQTLPASGWELVVVDNRSDEPLAGRIDLAWHPNARIVREETLGLTPARLRGIREASTALLVFVDDDNVLDPAYLAVALDVARERPYLGAWSGQCIPEFEQDPPAWTRRYWGNLSLREFDRDIWSNLPRLAETMPCGAGLCVRHAVARHYADLHDGGQRGFQFDRTGSSLISGGDNDLAGCACSVGLGVGLIASLQLTHLIPPQRMTVDYLTRLAEGISLSATLLDEKYGLEVRPRDALRRFADVVRLLRLSQPHRDILRAVHRGRDRAVAMLQKNRGQARILSEGR